MESVTLITTDEVILLVNIVGYVSLLSVIGSLFNIVTVLVLKISSASLGKMVIFLSSFDIILGLSSQMFMTKTESHLICQIRCFLWAFGWTGSIFWTCCFAHCLYVTVKKTDNTMPDVYFKRYCIVAPLLGILWGVYSLFINYFQVEYHMCYNNPGRENFKPFQIIIFQAPLYFGVVFSLGCYISVIRELVGASSRLFIELLLYPAILIICNSLTVIIALISTLNRSSDSPLWLIIMGVIFLNSQGILNALVYGLSKNLIKKFKEKCTQKSPTKFQGLEQNKLLVNEISSEISETSIFDKELIAPARYVTDL